MALPLRQCAHPGCFRLQRGSYCEQHAPKAGWDAKPRGTRQQRGYDRDWLRLRKAKLAHDPLCEECRRRGRRTPATTVDHIEEFHGLDDPLRLEWSNLQSLCAHCHQRKSSEAGAAARRRG